MKICPRCTTGEWTEGMVFAYFESEDFKGLADAHNAALAAVAPKLRQNLRDVCAERDKAQQQLAAEREKSIKDFATKILHGDEVHRAWLTESAEAYCYGHQLPSPRSSPITDEEVNEAWSELEAELDIGYITDGKTYECGQCGGKGATADECKHKEGCIAPSWNKVSNLNRKMFQQLREQLAAENDRETEVICELQRQLAAEREKHNKELREYESALIKIANDPNCDRCQVAVDALAKVAK